MTVRLEISALLGSRICHDLISPIGAIGNGVELLMLDGLDQGPEISLIAESVANANARLRFFRIAFGSASHEQSMSAAEVRSILADLSRSSRVEIEWNGPHSQSRQEMKLLCLLIMCLETAMAYGGHMAISREADRWQITGQAPRLKVDPDLWAVLSDREASFEVTAAQVQFALLPAELSRLKRNLDISIGSNEIRLIC